MRGQATTEYLIGLLVWLAFVGFIAAAIFNFGQGAAMANDVAERNMQVREITNLAEQLQSTCYSTYVAVDSHKTRNGRISIDYRGREIVGRTIVGVEEDVRSNPV